MLMLLMSSADFFKIIFFSKNNFGKTIRVPNSFDPNQDPCLSVLIWVRTVCNGYQQMTKVAASKERDSHLNTSSLIFLIGKVLISKGSVFYRLFWFFHLNYQQNSQEISSPVHQLIYPDNKNRIMVKFLDEYLTDFINPFHSDYR